MAHVVVLDSLEDIFVCGPCKAVFNSLNLFMSHKNLCLKQIPEDHCPKEKKINKNDIEPEDLKSTNLSDSNATIPKELEPLSNSETWTNDLICSLCKKKFKIMKNLLAHMKIHNGKPYQCPVCGRCFIQNSHLQRHYLSHKVWPDGLSETTAKSSEVELLSYSCPYCSIIIPNYCQFRAHLKNHVSLKKFKCIQGQCKEFYNTIEELIFHVQSNHASPVYICHICSCSFDSLEEIATHQQSHKVYDRQPHANVTQTKQFKCNLCDATFKKSERLSLHMLTENHRKVCIHCSKTFTSDKRLRLHLQIHRKLKPYQCNICSSSFHMKKYLSTHMLKHGNRQFKCSVCKYMFKRQDLLQRHMKLHQIKKFKCPFRDALDCKKEFSRSDKLKSHLNSHTKYVKFCSDAKVKMSNARHTVEIRILPLDTKLDDK